MIWLYKSHPCCQIYQGGAKFRDAFTNFILMHLVFPLLGILRFVSNITVSFKNDTFTYFQWKHASVRLINLYKHCVTILRI